jgi:hypothetical protein
VTDFGIDIEGAKRAYLAQWHHCARRSITAIDGALRCDCGSTFPWTQALGEDVALALEFEWLSPNAESSCTVTSEQPRLFG